MNIQFQQSPQEPGNGLRAFHFFLNDKNATYKRLLLKAIVENGLLTFTSVYSDLVPLYSAKYLYDRPPHLLPYVANLGELSLILRRHEYGNQ